MKIGLKTLLSILALFSFSFTFASSLEETGVDATPVTTSEISTTSEDIDSTTVSTDEENVTDYTGIEDSSFPTMDFNSNSLSNSADFGPFAVIAGIFAVVINILSLVFFLLQAWGLYMINKKLGEKYAWMSWIPVLNMYSFVKAGGKSGWWVLWIILGAIALVIPGMILAIIVTHGISKRTGRGVWTTLGLIFFPFIMYPVVGSSLQSKVQEPQTV